LPSQLAQFLAFVTSVPRPPLLGFKSLKHRIQISQMTHAEEGRLPSAATCFNQLKLPIYASEMTLREKLLGAISEGAGGFYLT
jgi:ubiquitin-protein ligase E3 C